MAGIMQERSACAKIILCGEHAVVYGRPAIALPLPGLRTFARAEAHHSRFEIRATDINHTVYMPSVAPTELRRPHPLALIAYLTVKHLNIRPPRARVIIRSSIPVGSNLGSGAAVSIALARAIAAFAGRELPPETASMLAYDVEKLHHGTPSGIDNTVVAYEQPVWFVRGNAPEMIELSRASTLPLVIGDTGESTPTRIPVGDVRAAWQADPAALDRQFDSIAALAADARAALSAGDLPQLGRLLNANHTILQQLGVSCASLDKLCAAARDAGALGAKMSGGGRGGNMLALARDPAHALQIGQALLAAGAKRFFIG
jgi:mevalonate kinase